MSGRPSRDIELPYQLPVDSTVYRMIPADVGWILPDGTPDPALFYRKNNDRDGVSVTTTVEAGLERLRRRGVEGVRSLVVGQVRNIEPVGRLDVRSKGAENTHAAITGLPYEEDDATEADIFAERLINISRDVPLPTR
jgi:hypothetical protein